MCPICGAASELPCKSCLNQLRRLPARFGPAGLGLANLGQSDLDFKELELGCKALFAYDEVASKLVLTLKYRRAMWLVKWLATQLAANLPTSQPDCITWIPAAKANRRKRGYDQGELLAKAVAKHKGIPAAALLLRLSDLPQGKRNRQGRLEGPALLSKPRAGAFRSKNVVIVDDVITTGTSLRRGAELLRSQGIARVGAVAIAARIRPNPRHSAAIHKPLLSYD